MLIHPLFGFLEGGIVVDTMGLDRLNLGGTAQDFTYPRCLLTEAHDPVKAGGVMLSHGYYNLAPGDPIGVSIEQVLYGFPMCL